MSKLNPFDASDATRASWSFGTEKKITQGELVPNDLRIQFALCVLAFHGRLEAAAVCARMIPMILQARNS